MSGKVVFFLLLFFFLNRDEWQGHIPPYVPEFYDGWQPAAGVIDELTARSALMSQPAIMPATVPMIEPARTQAVIEDRQRGYVCIFFFLHV